MRAISGKLRSGITAIGVVACTVGVAGTSVAAAARQYTYQVEMSPYGRIGTYRNAVESSGGETTITTDAHIKVSMIGVVLYRLDIARVEREVGNRLVYFHGLTTENGKPVVVDGRAAGEHFIITSPAGSVTAPGSIRLPDPWLVGSPGIGIVFMPDTGAVTRVETSGGEQTSIKINDVAMRVRHYRIDTTDGQERYAVWMDDHRTPVMFKIVDHDGATTFTLVR